MAERKIKEGHSVRLAGRHRVFKPGQEKELAKAIAEDTANENVPTPQVERLQEKGVLTGFVKTKAEPEGEDEVTPKKTKTK